MRRRRVNDHFRILPGVPIQLLLFFCLFGSEKEGGPCLDFIPLHHIAEVFKAELLCVHIC